MSMTRTPIATRSAKDKHAIGETDSVGEDGNTLNDQELNCEIVPISQQKKNKRDKEARKKMAAEYKVLINQMNALSRKLMRVKTVLEADNDDPNQSLDCKQFLQLQLKVVESVNADYNVHQQRAHGLDISDDDRSGLEELCIEFEQLYGELYIVLTKLFETSLKKEAHTVQPSAIPPVNVTHLPPLKVPLPSFDGSYENWYAFKSMFVTIMSRYTSEAPAIKLYHLRNSLVGKAAGIIDQEIINNNDYDAAWATLTERFEDRRLIIDKHIDALFDLPKLTNENAVGLRKLLDTCAKNVDALKNLGLPVSGLGERMLINRIALKLDSDTRKAWELEQASTALPDYDSTMDFLRERCRVLEKIHPFHKTQMKIPAKLQLSSPAGPRARANSLVTATDACPHCSEGHDLWKCDVFKKAVISDRYDTLRRTGACFNCLQKGHRTTDCSSKHSCKKCNKRHHTTLHPADNQQKKPDDSKTEVSQPNPEKKSVLPPERQHEETSIDAGVQSTLCTHPNGTGKQVLLSTAVVLVYGKSDVYPCRVLLDSGSHSNFVSEHFATMLSLKKIPANVSISGLNDIHTKVRLKIHTKIKSRISDFSACLDFFVIPRITGNLPLTKVNCTNIALPTGIQLADPNFSIPDRVDMLLGAEVFFEMLKSGRMRIPNTSAILQDTQFGWVLSGPIPSKSSKQQSFFISAEEDLNEIVRNFWRIESCDEFNEKFVPLDEICLDHFRDTHERTSEGRYVVRLPFNDVKDQLGDSKAMAEKRFLALEKRLDRAPEIKMQYIAFLREYETLGHMTLNEDVETDQSQSAYYLPHHYVLKPSSTTTRLRVVFDGSAPSDSGISINQTQMVGPAVQNDLISILLNFRSFKIAFVADIPKMYRQIRVNDEDVRYQRILWRENRSQPIRVYDLRTVTYGLASSPFLATMALRQLAEDEKERYPLGAGAVRKSFYIDDVLTGASSLEKAMEVKNQIVGLLNEGGFDAHKFCSNAESLLATIPEHQREGCVDITNPTVNTVMKTLGVSWNPKEDTFTFIVAECRNPNAQLTKRSILSQIARIFDPLGFVGPVITAAKLIMRELWGANLEWDQPVPCELAQLWTDYRDQLQYLNNVKIERWIFSNGSCTFELFGFADASDLAYGACLYARVIRHDGAATMNIICSKSRILPRKKNKQKEITTPRAELLAAMLLSQLTVKVLAAIDSDFSSVRLWSDSQIVLCWLQKSPEALTVFVGNRVRQIQQLTANYTWQYIPSKENPADLISRGVSPSELERRQRRHIAKGLPTATEMQRASILITRMVQGEMFHKELQMLRSDKECKLPFQNLSPFIDANDEVLRRSAGRRSATVLATQGKECDTEGTASLCTVFPDETQEVHAINGRSS
ncbi:uncharacterized protein LOC131433960 [Malaya genurostris]|uniref:uncharacterized protein LOC131433960 n=1 Tax=Malaya genurostris TaxID=325434 RepID=UPI0026F3B58E|nr:uncharacterized protein LOC131433960 [Malaya genurostris]